MSEVGGGRYLRVKGGADGDAPPGVRLHAPSEMRGVRANSATARTDHLHGTTTRKNRRSPSRRRCCSRRRFCSRCDTLGRRGVVDRVVVMFCRRRTGARGRRHEPPHRLRRHHHHRIASRATAERSTVSPPRALPLGRKRVLDVWWYGRRFCHCWKVLYRSYISYAPRCDHVRGRWRDSLYFISFCTFIIKCLSRTLLISARLVLSILRSSLQTRSSLVQPYMKCCFSLKQRMSTS